MHGRCSGHNTLSHIDLFHTIKRLEESTPELVPRVFAIAETVDAAVLLKLHNFADGFLFNWDELFRCSSLVGDSITLLDKLIRAQERPDMFCGSVSPMSGTRPARGIDTCAKRWGTWSGRHGA